MSIAELYSQSRRAASLGITVALALGLAKLVGGVFGHSIALLSDAVHSLGDALLSFGVWMALRWSELPPDVEHPYGHMRSEAVAGSNVAVLLIISALALIWQSVRTMREPSPEPEAFALWIAAASVIVNEALYRYNRRIARRTGSTAVRATAWDQRMDALSSVAVLVALAIVKWGGPAYHAADHVAAVLVAVTILWAGLGLFWKSVQELMDRQADDDLLRLVREEAASVPGVLNVEKLLMRKTGLEYLVDIHVEVDPEITVREGHTIAHLVKDRLVGRVVPVKDVLVHVEPAPGKPAAAKSV
jgi:cation diffusion facilitator family transporter